MGSQSLKLLFFLSKQNGKVKKILNMGFNFINCYLKSFTINVKDFHVYFF